CRHWLRDRKPALARLPAWESDDWSVNARDAEPADSFDLEVELERGELATLLDRAMGRLPPETRQVLVERFVEETPQAETALRLGLSEGAVAMRLRRGKLALRRILSGELREQALAYGLIPAPGNDWQTTRIWCPSCGRQKIEGRFRPEVGELLLRCPSCSRGHLQINSTLPEKLSGIKTYPRGIARVLEVIHERFRERVVDGLARCPGCQRWRPLRQGRPAWIPLGELCGEVIYIDCPGCARLDRETWQSLTWSLPAVRRFWKQHPRLRYLGEQEIDAAGHPAVTTGFASFDEAARIEVVSRRETFEVLSVDGHPPIDLAEKPQRSAPASERFS
ncbi:MAG: RNA polymerase sigma factor, partial [Chloroflexota bacterium]